MSDNRNEVWKAVVGYEQFYDVSNYGRVRAKGLRKQLMKPCAMKKGKGYYAVKLRRKHAFVHRLVWVAFGGPIPEGHQINHKNGNHFDNRIENLECVTGRQNVDHATENDLVNFGERQWLSKLTEEQVREIKRVAANGKVNQSALARQYGVLPQTINHILTGRNWKRVKIDEG